ncbi:MAG: hypothetical protein KAR39_00280 [Thermoplasmata archaeon]|nr:hypothetical protein [Thermoplasmata archaeon]
MRSGGRIGRNVPGRVMAFSVAVLVTSGVVLALTPFIGPTIVAPPTAGTLDVTFYDIAPDTHTFPGDDNVTMIWLEMTASGGDVQVISLDFTLGGTFVAGEVSSVVLWDDSSGIAGPDKLQGYYECELTGITNPTGSFTLPTAGNLNNCKAPFGNYIVPQFQNRYILVFVSVSPTATEGNTIDISLNAMSTDGTVIGDSGQSGSIEILHVFFSDDMESGMGSWTAEGWDKGHMHEPDGLWHLSSGEENCTNNVFNQPFYQSPPTGWWYGHRFENQLDPGTYVCSYHTWMPGDYLDSSHNMGNLTSPNIDASTGGNLAVTFRHMLVGEPDTPLYKVDNGHLWLNDGAWSEVSPFPGGYDSTDNSWWKETVNLSAYAGKRFKLEFRFDTLDALNNMWLGWFVDDITVYGRDLFPPRPPSITTKVVDGNDVLLEWTPYEPNTTDHYLIYRSPDQREFNFTAPVYDTSSDPYPLRTNWTDVDAAGPSAPTEYYYIVRAVSPFGIMSNTSNTAGKWTKEFSSGLNTFSLPLEPFEIRNISWYASDIANVDFVRWLDVNDHWVTHRKGMGAGVNDAPVMIGEGYEVKLTSLTRYTFCGYPASMIRFHEGLGVSPDFRRSLSAEKSGLSIDLEWNHVLGASGYDVFRSENRYGLNGLLPPPVATLPAGQNTWTDVDVLLSVGEYYYMVVPLDSKGTLGSSSYSIGIVLVEFEAGHSTLGLPLEPISVLTIDHYCEDGLNVVGLAYMQKEVWKFHATAMPFGAYDPVMEQSEGYQISVNGIASRYTIIGF